MASRIDQRLVELGLASSRAKAQALIEGGAVTLLRPDKSSSIASKASLRIGPDVRVLIKDGGAGQPVSRAAFKLDALLTGSAGQSVAGALCIDAGQSTGGFTERLLQHGAAYVLGIEVGHDQLATGLQSDHRVGCLEHTNIKSCTRESLAAFLAARQQPALSDRITTKGADIITADLSFISLRKVLPTLAALLAETGRLLALVKPQFELGPGAVNRRGVVTRHALLAPLREEFAVSLASVGMTVDHWLPIPITGSDGNTEFLLCASKRFPHCS